MRAIDRKDLTLDGSFRGFSSGTACTPLQMAGKSCADWDLSRTGIYWSAASSGAALNNSAGSVVRPGALPILSALNAPASATKVGVSRITIRSGTATGGGVSKVAKSQQVACSASAKDCPKARRTSCSSVTSSSWTRKLMAGLGALNLRPCLSTARMAVAIASTPRCQAACRCSLAYSASSRPWTPE